MGTLTTIKGSTQPHNQPTGFLTQKTLDQRESPWIECTTISNINFIRLHVQDEYGQMIIGENNKMNQTFYATLEFADIPL